MSCGAEPDTFHQQVLEVGHEITPQPLNNIVAWVQSKKKTKKNMTVRQRNILYPKEYV